MGAGKLEKSWNFIVAFSRPGKSWNKATDPGKLWKYVQPRDYDLREHIPVPYDNLFQSILSFASRCQSYF